MQIILDMSANTFGDDLSYIMQMMDEIKEIDTGKHRVVFKTQLFKSAPPNVPLKHEVFDFMYAYGKKLGYQVTSSVFDKESLDFLLKYDVPFIKTANNRKFDYLIGEVPRKIQVYTSVSKLYWSDCDEIDTDSDYSYQIIPLACVSKYPATIEEYEEKFPESYYNTLHNGVSDHTVGLTLFKKYQPLIWEKHYRLEGSTGLDAGPFAITPRELEEIL
jgi:sialic acid synthase SpsE